MQILENISLRPFNTFGIDARAKWLAAFKSVKELQEVLTEKPIPRTRGMVLGGGSNVLFTSDFDGLVLKNEIKGIEKTKEDEDHVYVTVGAGENWHQFV